MCDRAVLAPELTREWGGCDRWGRRGFGGGRRRRNEPRVVGAGRLLAHHTGWPFLDNDELLLQIVGKTPRALLAEDGEETLRASESAALRMGLASPAPSIVSAAGGVILDPDNRRDLQGDAAVIWLKATDRRLNSECRESI